jgi:hypothetical protein
MRRSVLAALLVAALAVPARADSVPTRSLSCMAGVRSNVGALGKAYGWGWPLIGCEAAIQPGPIGFSWSLLWGWYFASDATAVESYIGILELGASLRTRFRIPGDPPAFIWLQAGVELLRGTIPLPPDNTSGYIGPTLGGGFGFVMGSWIMTIGASYSPIVACTWSDGVSCGSGPSGLSLLLSVGIGGK